MSTAYAPTPPATPGRGFFARQWADPESRSAIIGLGGVLLVHLLLLLLAPYLLRPEPITPGSLTSRTAAKQFNIVMDPNTFISKPKPPPPPPFKFVEVNPDAPENVPDKTNNFGAQNQQVAQEKPAEKESDTDRPETKGKKDFDAIVTGQLTKLEERMTVAPEPDVTPQEAQPVAKPRAEQNPLSGFEQKTGDSATGIGTNIAKRSENATAVPEKVEGAKDVKDPDETANQFVVVDPTRPRSRPTLANQKQVRSAILAENPIGTRNIGPMSYDAKWSNYGQYLQRMIEAIELSWNNILRSSRVYPPGGTSVFVKFRISSDGKITAIIDVETTSSEQGKEAAVTAITSRAPYGKWTDDMVALLGDSQELTFRFYYDPP